MKELGEAQGQRLVEGEEGGRKRDASCMVPIGPKIARRACQERLGVYHKRRGKTDNERLRRAVSEHTTLSDVCIGKR